MSGHTLICATLPYNIFSRSKLNPGGSIHNKYKDHSGFEVQLIREVGKVLHFKVDFVNPATDDWGHLNANKTGFTGMMGMIAEGRVDLGLAEFSVNADRNKVDKEACYLNLLSFFRWQLFPHPY